MGANCLGSMESNKCTSVSVHNIIFIIHFLNYISTCRNVMANKIMEIDQSILDNDNEDDSTIMGRESISSLFVRACGMGHEEVFEYQPGDCTPQARRTRPSLSQDFRMHTISCAPAAGTGSRPLVCVGLALTLGRLGVAMGGSAWVPSMSRVTADNSKSRTSTG